MVRSLRQNAQGVWQAAATYLTGPRGMEYRRDDLAGQVRWYVYDGLGSVVGELDPSGNLTAGKKYDVYGAERTGGTGTSTTRQGFCGSLGHVADAETGLVYMRARYYDPNLGRFVSQDPAKNGCNWFTYCADNPVNAVDPDGRTLKQITGAILALYVALNAFGVGWTQYMAIVEAVWTTAAEKIAMSSIIQGIGATIGERSPAYAEAAYDITCMGAGLSVAATITAIAAIHALMLVGVLYGLDGYDDKIIPDA